jgi:glycine/D-amino acid oxidase-like deaminating enzyme
MFRRIKARAQLVILHVYLIADANINSKFIPRSWKIPCEIISVNEVASMCPMIQTSDVLGGLWIPGDGVGDPYEICVSLVSQVKKKGISRNNFVFPSL